MTSSITRTVAPPLVGSDLPRPLTTPAVTLPASPRGLPTATTSWPTWSLEASPKRTGRGVAPSARTTARSERGSMPTTWELTALPSANVSLAASALPTTCALVRRNPSSVNTTADPAPPANVPFDRRWRTSIAATLWVRSRASVVTTCEYASKVSVVSAATSVVAWVITPPDYWITSNRLRRSPIPAGHRRNAMALALRLQRRRPEPSGPQ